MRAGILALAGLLTAGATAQNVWTVTSGTNDWYGDIANWSLGHFPQAGEAVVITNKGVGVLLTNAAPAAGCLDSLTISNTATLIFTNWTTSLSATNIWIQKSATVTCAGPFTNAPAMSNRVWLACSNLMIDGGGTINVDYKGYQGSTSITVPGCGPGGGAAGGDGGSHGGFGGKGGPAICGGNYPCGDPLAPLAPGSGGGGGVSAGGIGGAGGGAIRISATGRVLVNGSISANGDANHITQAGGGSGGSIYITCQTIGGTNLIQANGGGGQIWGADGGGGRIALDYNAPAQSNAAAATLRLTVLPGIQATVANSIPFNILAGDLGTISLPDTALLYNPINVSGQLLIGNFLSWSPSQLTVSNAWVRFPQEGFHLTVLNDLTIVKGSSIGRLDVGATMFTNFNGGTSDQFFPYCRLFAATTPPKLSVGGNLILTNGAVLAVFSAPTNGATPVYGSLVAVTNELRVGTRCWVYPYSHWSNGGSPFFSVGSLTVATNAGFNADSSGYAGGANAGAGAGNAGAGFGPGGGTGISYAVEAGGSYGGLGGRAAAGKSYGSSNAPAMPGSGGAGGFTVSVPEA